MAISAAQKRINSLSKLNESLKAGAFADPNAPTVAELAALSKLIGNKPGELSDSARGLAASQHGTITRLWEEAQAGIAKAVEAGVASGSIPIPENYVGEYRQWGVGHAASADGMNLSADMAAIYNAAPDAFYTAWTKTATPAQLQRDAEVAAITTEQRSGGGGFGGLGSVLGAAIGIALAPVTGGTSLALAANGAIGGAVFNAVTGGDPLEGALIGGVVGLGAGALGFGGAAAGEAAAGTAASTAGTAAAETGLLGAPTMVGATDMTGTLISTALNPVTAGNIGLSTAASTAAADLTAGIIATTPLAPATGGFIVGTNGVIGSTGNSVIDSVVNNAVTNGIKAELTGGDFQDGALGSGVATLVGNFVPNDLFNGVTGNTTIDTALGAGTQKALTSAAGAAVTGQDIGNAALAGGTIGAADTLINSVLPPGENTVLNPALTSGTNNAIIAGVNGGDVGNAFIIGAGSNLVGSAVDAGLNAVGVDSNSFLNDAAQTVATVVAADQLNQGNPVFDNTANNTTFVNQSTVANQPLSGVNSIGSMIDQNAAPGLLSGYQSRAVQRANAMRV